MDIKIIKNDADYAKAISFLEAAGDTPDFESNQELIQQFDLISTLVDHYEKAHFPIENGHPLEIIKLKMDMLGILQKDLISIIGSSGVVSEVFNKKRGLSKNMIREFSELLHIDQNIINVPYTIEGQSVKNTKTTVFFAEPIFNFIDIHDQMIKRFSIQTRKEGMLFNVNAYC